MCTLLNKHPRAREHSKKKKKNTSTIFEFEKIKWIQIEAKQKREFQTTSAVIEKQ